MIGSAADDRGKVAFGAPGLRSAGRSGGGEEPWVPLAIAVGAAAARAGRAATRRPAASAARWERRRA